MPSIDGKLALRIAIILLAAWGFSLLPPAACLWLSMPCLAAAIYGYFGLRGFSEPYGRDGIPNEFICGKVNGNFAFIRKMAIRWLSAAAIAFPAACLVSALSPLSLALCLYAALYMFQNRAMLGRLREDIRERIEAERS